MVFGRRAIRLGWADCRVYPCLTLKEFFHDRSRQ